MVIIVIIVIAVVIVIIVIVVIILALLERATSVKSSVVILTCQSHIRKCERKHSVTEQLLSLLYSVL